MNINCQHGISIQCPCQRCMDAIIAADEAAAREPEITYIELDASIPVITLARALASHGLCLHNNAATGKLQIRARSVSQV